MLGVGVRHRYFGKMYMATCLSKKLIEQLICTSEWFAIRYGELHGFHTSPWKRRFRQICIR